MYYIEIDGYATEEYDDIESWAAQLDYYNDVLGCDIQVEGNYAFIAQADFDSKFFENQ